jgi:hypothetical protein
MRLPGIFEARDQFRWLRACREGHHHMHGALLKSCGQDALQAITREQGD